MGLGDAFLPHHLPGHPPLLCRFFGLRSFAPLSSVFFGLREGGVPSPALPLWIPAYTGMTGGARDDVGLKCARIDDALML